MTMFEMTTVDRLWARTFTFTVFTEGEVVVLTLANVSLHDVR